MASEMAFCEVIEDGCRLVAPHPWIRGVVEKRDELILGNIYLKAEVRANFSTRRNALRTWTVDAVIQIPSVESQIALFRDRQNQLLDKTEKKGTQGVALLYPLLGLEHPFFEPQNGILAAGLP